MADDYKEFLAWIDSLSEPILIATVDRICSDAHAGDNLAINQMRVLLAKRTIPDCNCSGKLIPCSRPECIETGLQNECDHWTVSFAHCKHQNKDGKFLPLICQHTLLAYREPKKYLRPKLPDALIEEMVPTSQPAIAKVMEERAKRHRHIRHPMDIAVRLYHDRRLAKQEDRINRHGHRNANGSDAKHTTLTIHGREPQEKDDLFSWLAIDARTAWLAQRGLLAHTKTMREAT